MKTYLVPKIVLACLLSFMLCRRLPAKLTETAQRCGAHQNQPPARVYADSDGRGWREYQDVKSVPELELHVGSAVQVWSGANGSLLVHLQGPGDDFAAYTDYCFDKAGVLVQLRYELRTAWGWGYREEGPFANGKRKAERSEFFATDTEQAIKKPDQADDVSDALKPRIFPDKSRLPFVKLLPKGMV